MTWIDDIRLTPLSPRMSRSTVANGVVQQSAETLLSQANVAFRQTLEEYTGARLAASEHDSGSPQELVAIIDSELNRARGSSLFSSLTAGTGKFGSQGYGDRPASTARDPGRRHLAAAKIAMGPQRGFTNGATRFYSPSGQQASYLKYKAGLTTHIHSCDAAGILEAWAYDYPRRAGSGRRCPPDRSRRGPGQMQWVGPVAGIDAWELMLMRPKTTEQEHARMYREASQVLATRGAYGGAIAAVMSAFASDDKGAESDGESGSPFAFLAGILRGLGDALRGAADSVRERL